MIEIKCESCGKVVKKNQSQIKDSKHLFCSNKCHYNWRHINNISYKKNNQISDEQKIKISNTIKRKIEDGTYDLSNLKKYKKGNIPWNNGLTKKDDKRIPHGENHPQWCGGVTPYYTETDSWNILRKKIYKRDRYTCQRCGKTHTKLACHHIIPFRISKNHNEDNLMTVCLSCHAILDNLQRNLNG